jgi:cell division septal protein FtsQ
MTHRRTRAAYRRYDASAAPALHKASQANARRWSRPRVASVAILTLAMLASAWAWMSDDFYVMQPQVTGNTRVPAEAISAGSGLRGLHAFWVNASAIEAQLIAAVPSIRNAQVTCALPARCAIHVTEREPLLTWRRGESEVWIDENGTAFTAQGEPATTVLIEALDGAPVLPGQQLRAEWLETIRAGASALPEVQSFRFTAARGLEFEDAGGYAVYLGIGANMDERVALWRALHEQLVLKGIQPKYVDVRYVLAPYYEK